MTKDILSEVVKKILSVSKKMKVKVALMGGIAANVYARPRTTYDVDGIILDFGKRVQKSEVCFKI